MDNNNGKVIQVIGSTLDAQFPDGPLKIVRPLAGGLGKGRIGKVTGIGNPGLFFLGGDLVLQLGCHPLEFGHHQLDLIQLATLVVDLKLLQANMALT